MEGVSYNNNKCQILMFYQTIKSTFTKVYTLWINIKHHYCVFKGTIYLTMGR